MPSLDPLSVVDADLCEHDDMNCCEMKGCKLKRMVIMEGERHIMLPLERMPRLETLSPRPCFSRPALGPSQLG